MHHSRSRIEPEAASLDSSQLLPNFLMLLFPFRTDSINLTEKSVLSFHPITTMPPGRRSPGKEIAYTYDAHKKRS